MLKEYDKAVGSFFSTESIMSNNKKYQLSILDIRIAKIHGLNPNTKPNSVGILTKMLGFASLGFKFSGFVPVTITKKVTC